MIAYVDSSVLLRVLLGQPNSLKEFVQIKRPISSKLLKIESLRALDRMRVRGLLTETEFVKAAEELHDSVDAVEWIEITHSVLDRACASFSVALGTLDAIHLSSAVLWKEQTDTRLTFLTHDEMLGRAARAMGFQVLGCADN